MIFQWPLALWGLVVVPLLGLAYTTVLARRRAAAARYPSWVMAGRNGSRRHVPPVLMLIALMMLIGAMARPAAVLRLPSARDTVILAIDVSGSMRAADIAPSRLAAAQKAAKDFVARQPRTTQNGLVAFAGTAFVVQRPTANREDLLAAVDRLETQDGTTIGGAILVALQALFPKETIDVPPPEGKKAKSSETAGPPAQAAAPPVAPGSETASAIVLLSDGQATAGPDAMEATKLAADHGVRIFTVGLGTKQGEVLKEHGISVRVQLDEDTLKKIADATRGRYFQAGTETDLREIYRDLTARLITETHETEISAFFVAAAALLALAAAVCGLAWFDRMV